MENPQHTSYNTVLHLGITFCKVLIGMVALALMLVTIVLVHLQMDPELYEPIQFKGAFAGPGFLDWSSATEYSVNGQEPGDHFALPQITSASLFLNYLQVVTVLVMVVLILWQLMRVLRSVEARDLLARSRAFGKIARCLLAIVIITSYTSVYARQGHTNHFSIGFTPLLLVVAAFVIARILRKEYEAQVRAQQRASV